MKVCPAIVNVEVLGALPEFAETVKFTVPFPDPLAPPVKTIQLALLAAVQEQPDPEVTPTEPGPPAALKDPEVADRP